MYANLSILYVCLCVCAGHVDEVWGLATHPCLPQFVSAGWDRLLQLWDGMSHSTVWSKDIDVGVRDTSN